MTKESTIDEKSIDYIRANKDELAIRHYKKFIVFSEGKILRRFMNTENAEKFVEKQGITLFVIWHFNELPKRAAAGVFFDKKKLEESRKAELNRQRSRRDYIKRREQILAKRKIDREKDPQKNRDRVKRSYWRDHEKTLRNKKLQRLGMSTQKTCNNF